MVRPRKASGARRTPSLAAGVAIAVASSTTSALAQYDRSAPAMLQFFDSSWSNMTRRAPDVFMAGYGGVWIPPSYRADSGNQSVGYDLYDRFDLGTADNPTLYGTENTLKRAVVELRRAGGASVYADLLWNHNGFSDYSNGFFASAGGYPGFVAGDFHPGMSVDADQYRGRLSGLIDIDHSTNNRYVRNTYANARDAGGNLLTNIPAGTSPQFGRLANTPVDANRRFYQDRNRAPDRTINGVPMWDYTADTLTTGDAVEENAVGYLMRHAQWMVQHVGVDGFRLDATKHMPTWVLNDFYDLSVADANPRLNLDGSRKSVFSFGEAFDGSKTFLQGYIRKDTTGNLKRDRDTKDFPLFFALQGNLTSNGFANDWRNVVGASVDSQDDGFANNGSQGVAFTQSHDTFGPALSNVAHAYTLMRPGNAIVYFNAKGFGNGRDFPKDGRGDALGGLYGSTLTTLTNLRHTHGRGNYIERWLNKETLVYERDRSAVVALSNRTDNGYDNVTVQTNFAAGTRLLEMTGNATDASVDPTGLIADYVVVDGSGRININVPRNASVNGNAHSKGYVVYGLPTPRGTLSVVGKSATVAGGTPTDASNGTTRTAALDVVTADQFTIRLQTTPVVIGGYTDVAAGGDNALFSINGGAKPDGSGNDLNGTGSVDYRTAGSLVYGFEEFRSVKSPLVGGGSGDYQQTIDVNALVEGFNYLEIRAFRARPAGEPPVYSSFKRVIYVDRSKATSELTSITNAGGNDRAVRVTNADATADNVHVLLDVGSALTDAQLLNLVGGGSQATQIDATLWSRTLGNVGTGNHNLAIVTYEPSGNYSIRRLSGQFIQTGRGAGLGDVNYDGAYTAADAGNVSGIETFLYSRNAQFNAAADLNADGSIDNRDLFALPARFTALGATAAAAEARAAIVRRGNIDGSGATGPSDIDLLFTQRGATGDIWLYDLNVDGAVSTADVDTLVTQMLLTRYGDANLDRSVNFSDLLVLAQGYGNAGTWATGDFSGDRRVDFTDLLALAQNYGGVGLLEVPGAALAFAADWALAQSLVPEPGTLTVLSIALALPRRRRPA